MFRPITPSYRSRQLFKLSQSVSYYIQTHIHRPYRCKQNIQTKRQLARPRTERESNILFNQNTHVQHTVEDSPKRPARLERQDLQGEEGLFLPYNQTCDVSDSIHGIKSPLSTVLPYCSITSLPSHENKKRKKSKNTRAIIALTLAFANTTPPSLFLLGHSGIRKSENPRLSIQVRVE